MCSTARTRLPECLPHRTRPFGSSGIMLIRTSRVNSHCLSHGSSPTLGMSMNRTANGDDTVEFPTNLHLKIAEARGSKRRSGKLVSRTDVLERRCILDAGHGMTKSLVVALEFPKVDLSLPHDMTKSFMVALDFPTECHRSSGNDGSRT